MTARAAKRATPEAQPSLDLPLFDGKRPVGTLVTLGRTTSQHVHRVIKQGERVILLVEAVADDVHHPTTADGMKRAHELKGQDFYELTGAEGHDLLVRLRAAYLEERGITELPMNGDEGVPVTVDGETGSVNAAELQAVVDLERGRGRCAHVINADTFELCKRPAKHRGGHDPA